jgi:hypothetical protein
VSGVLLAPLQFAAHSSLCNAGKVKLTTMTAFAWPRPGALHPHAQWNHLQTLQPSYVKFYVQLKL